MVEIEVVDGVHVVHMRAGENRFDGAFVDALGEAVTSVEEAGAPLVLTGAGKFFCYGLDLEWLSEQAGTEGGAAATGAMMARLHELLAQLLVFPAPTVAAVNGHAFGAGALLAAAAAHRVMRTDRGFFCFPEVDLGLVMSPEFDAILRARYPRAVHLGALVTGQRHGGEAAVAAGLVHEAVDEASLLPTALARAAAHAGKDPRSVQALKAQVHAVELAVLRSGSGAGG